MLFNDENLKKKWSEVVAKSWLDPQFKQRLLDHPKEVLREMKIPVEDRTNYKVLENTSQTTYFVLPAKPGDDLSEVELRKVAGGFCCDVCHK